MFRPSPVTNRRTFVIAEKWIGFARPTLAAPLGALLNRSAARGGRPYGPSDAAVPAVRPPRQPSSARFSLRHSI